MASPLSALLSAAPTPLERLHLAAFDEAGAELWLKREDLRDPLLGGNKWYKLQGHLRAAAGRRLLSFGGAWSNHLHALAAAGQRFGLETVGVVRGHQDSAMLADCRAFGMRLIPVDYGQYRQREEAGWVASLLRDHGLEDCYVIPEGGGGAEGLAGFASLAAELEAVDCPTTVAVAMGTGTTLAGLAAHLSPNCQIWGFPVLPLPEMQQKLAKWLAETPDAATYRVWHDLVDQGYGRLTPELRDFMAWFECHHSIPLDPVYTVKLIWALNSLAKQGGIPRGSRIVALHSGGLQGRRGFALPVVQAA